MAFLRCSATILVVAVALRPEAIRAQACPAGTELTGVVADRLSGAPLPGATVILRWLVGIESIERLEVQRRPVVKNMLTFALIGGLAGVAAHEFRERFQARHFLVGGAAFGLVFGLTQTEWRVTFPR